MIDTNFVLVYPTPHNTAALVNYSEKKEVNDFLKLFDVWGSKGEPCKYKCEGTEKFYKYFEGSMDIYYIMKDNYENVFKNVFKKLDVKLEFSLPEDFANGIREGKII